MVQKNGFVGSLKDVPEFLTHFKNREEYARNVGDGVPDIVGSIGRSMREKRPEMKRSPCELNPCKISTHNSKYQQSYSILKIV